MFGHGWYPLIFISRILFPPSCQLLPHFLPKRVRARKRKRACGENPITSGPAGGPPMYDMPAKDSKWDHGQGWDKTR